MKSMREVAFLAMMGLAATAGASELKQYEATAKPDWTRNAVIYEVNWRQATDEGTVAAFEKRLPYLKELGVDILWFMPVNPISVVNRKGELGSYYASANYTALNPELGDIEEFKSMVAEAHKLGMKVMIDWVANHSGCDNVWLNDHPDWYERDKAGKLIQPWDWTDTYKLNYANAEMREAMFEAMKFWVKECDIDGFRCDVAFMVPLEFWQETFKRLDEIKPLFYLAEAANKEITDGAFDMVYNWPLGFLFDKIAKGEKDCSVIDTIVKVERDSFAIDAYQMNHITNHDRNSWDGTEFERLKGGVKAFATLSYILPGMPLIYTGQEVGYDHRFEFFKKDTPAPFIKNEWFYFYKSLNELKHTNAALRAGTKGGEWHNYGTTNPKQVVVFSRRLGSDEVLYIANLSDKPAEFKFNEMPEGKFKNWFTDVEVEGGSNDDKILAPWEFILLVR